MSGKQSKRMRKFWASIPEDEKVEMMSEIGKKGGINSVEVRLGGMSAEEKSAYMKKVRAKGILKTRLKEQYELKKRTKNNTSQQGNSNP